MKTVYVTYKQNGLLKKATINEDRYASLLKDPSVTNLTVYPSPLLMENNYAAQCAQDGSCGMKGFLRG
jgi:hypothetical protein